MKNTIRIFCFFLTILLIFLSSCNDKSNSDNDKSNSDYEYEYSENHTEKYFAKNYESFDQNLVYSSCAEYCNNGYGSYAAIKDVSIDDFVATSAQGVLRRIGNETDPLNDWTVSRVIIYWNRQSDLKEEDYRNYGLDCVLLEEKIIEDKAIIGELLEKIKTASSLEYDKAYKWYDALIIDKKTGSKEQVMLHIRLCFEESDSIFWDARVYCNSQNQNYIDFSENLSDKHIPLTEYFDSVISDIANQWNN